MALAAHIKWGMTRPDISSQIATNHVALFPNFPLNTMIRVYSSMIARYLYTEGVLNEINAPSLAWSFAEMLEDCESQTSNRTQAISNAFINILSSFVHLNNTKGWKLAIISGNAWQTEAHRLGLL
ncbi:hypothetical protein TNIN_225171 [Trichonephila inaurata madagascariensis]|uniref:Uncharacterized protein n=1 Tax=Trichonephila inaurata madagascariensis TaxID=2747483 RepID=A0A8X6XGX7_9ARAC|nr:hypothetical protein TNIN_225171 [Trichonephila inaurata madagascariensis]